MRKSQVPPSSVSENYDRSQAPRPRVKQAKTETNNKHTRPNKTNREDRATPIGSSEKEKKEP